MNFTHRLCDVSRLEVDDKNDANNIALQIEQQVKSGENVEATDSWSQLVSSIGSASNGVNFYNFLLDSSVDPLSSPTSTLHSMVISSPGLGYQDTDTNPDLDTNPPDF